MKILINVVNARNVGGGLQVVHNFLLGTLKYPYFDVEWYYAVSECLDTVYLNDEFKSKVEGHYFVFPNQPDFFHTYRKTQKNLRRLENKIKPDVIYTILGPTFSNIVKLLGLYILGLLLLTLTLGAHFRLRQK